MVEFWSHCLGTEEYKHHPALQCDQHTLGSMFPVTLHIDGAEIHNNTEFMHWSVSFPFGDGTIYDRKIPILAVRFEEIIDLKTLHKEAPWPFTSFF